MTPHTLIKDNQEVTYNFPAESFHIWLESLAKNFGQKPAVVFAQTNQEPSTLRYHELFNSISHLSQWLQSIEPTISKSEPPALGFAFENSPEVILLNYAAWSAGWCSVPLDTTRDTTERKMYKLQQAQCRLLISRTGMLSTEEKQAIQQAMSSLQIIEVESYQELINIGQAESKKSAASAQTDILSQLSSTPLTSIDNIDLTTHPALILYTSGTTALPKGAVLSITNLFANAACVSNWLKITDQDRWAVVLPLHHINSTTFVNSVLLSGGTVVLIPHYSKSQFWQQMATFQVTGTSVVPTVAFDQLSETAAFDKYQPQLKQLTRIQIGSAPVQPSSVKQFVERFGITLVQGYGQTETSLRSTGVPFPSELEQYQWAVESNTLGTELTYTNVTVLDEQGQELPAGEVGEICVRGPIIMQRYLDNEAETTKAFTYDWFHSGDTGYWEEHEGQKYFFMKGRSKEIIKKGGVLISPLAIENALLAAYPDLQQAYVIGFPDQRLGEQIGLIAVGQANIGQTILSEAKVGQLKGLQAYEYPVAVMEIAESDLPKTSTGKVQRVELRRLYADKLLDQYRTVAKSGTFTFRLIGSEETDLLEQAVHIDQARWGKVLGGTIDQFTQRAEHGVLIGCIDQQGKVQGTISALRISKNDLNQAGEPDFYTSTWDGVTANGTLQTHNHKGDSLLLVSVASAGNSSSASVNQEEKSDLSLASNQGAVKKSDLTASGDSLSNQQLLEQYFQSDQDPVLRFHYTAKGGMKEGAHFVKALPQARPADTQAAGYCVLVKYPPLEKEPTVDPRASVGTMLVEAALLYAFQQGIKEVFAYSRPVELGKFLNLS